MTLAGGCWPWGGATDEVLASLGVATVTVPSPTGYTAKDTPAVVNAAGDLKQALSFGLGEHRRHLGHGLHPGRPDVHGYLLHGHPVMGAVPGRLR